MNKLLSRRSFLTRTAAALAASQLRWIPAARADTAPRRSLRFGVQTPQQFATYDEILSVWKDVDALGYDTAFVFDHFVPIFSDDTGGPCLEGWSLLSALATETEKVRLGVLVTGNTYRNPALLAKMAATVDHVSNGRLILGMGAGWFELEHEAYGIPFYTPGERARRLGEAVEAIKELFANERTDYDGKYYDMKDAPFAPKAVQKPHPPILIGGMGPKVIQPIVARHADIWHFFVRNGPAEAKRVNEGFDAICREVGRDPAAVERAMFLRSPAMKEQSDAEIRAEIEAYAQAGAQHFIISLVPPYDRDLVKRFAENVIPKLR